MTTKKLVINKGLAAEEELRAYFLTIGYFVARGCKFRLGNFDVTDVDLWLYGKGSSFSRTRVNVDIKNRKTPQALERIFWAKGLQEVLGFEECIVATTDTRPEILTFGLKHGVHVLDGAFLSRMKERGKFDLVRISEEELFADLVAGSLGKLGGDWKGRYEASKSRLLEPFSFDGANAWLIEIQYIMEQLCVINLAPPAAYRLLYLLVSHFLIAVDFIMHDFVGADRSERAKILDNGFRFGSAGREYIEKISALASSLLASLSPDARGPQELALAISDQAAGIKADILSEFFSRGQVQSALFDAAKEFEAIAFNPCVLSASELKPELWTILGVLADFSGCDRKKILA
ncbi:MAG: hypothetical protein EOP06_03135 [Proteobacteria bacterium]|nr:MAG: hypothetical protein EOP06_03135 [Pseudomonadota bacterium]